MNHVTTKLLTLVLPVALVVGTVAHAGSPLESLNPGTFPGWSSDGSHIHLGESNSFTDPLSGLTNIAGCPGVTLNLQDKVYNSSEFIDLYLVQQNAHLITTPGIGWYNHHGHYVTHIDATSLWIRWFRPSEYIGLINFARVDHTKTDCHGVWYGEWSQYWAGDDTHTVDYIGDGPSYAPTQSATYTLQGLSDYTYACPFDVASGTLTVLTVAGTPPTLSGELHQCTYSSPYFQSITFNGVPIDSGYPNSFYGTAHTTAGFTGHIRVNFYGPDASKVAGIVYFENTEFDTAFGGSK